MRGQRGGRRAAAARGDWQLNNRFWTASPQAHRVRLQRWTTRTPLEAIVVLCVAVEVTVVVAGGLVVYCVLWWGSLLQDIFAGVGRAHGGTWYAAATAGGMGGGFFAVVKVAVVLLGSVRSVWVVEKVGVFAGVAALADAVECEEGGGGDDEGDEGDGDGDDCGR